MQKLATVAAPRDLSRIILNAPMMGAAPELPLRWRDY